MNRLHKTIFAAAVLVLASALAVHEYLGQEDPADPLRNTFVYTLDESGAVGLTGMDVATYLRDHAHKDGTFTTPEGYEILEFLEDLEDQEINVHNATIHLNSDGIGISLGAATRKSSSTELLLASDRFIYNLGENGTITLTNLGSEAISSQRERFGMELRPLIPLLHPDIPAGGGVATLHPDGSYAINLYTNSSGPGEPDSIHISQKGMIQISMIDLEIFFMVI